MKKIELHLLRVYAGSKRRPMTVEKNGRAYEWCSEYGLSLDSGGAAVMDYIKYLESEVERLKRWESRENNS